MRVTEESFNIMCKYIVSQHDEKPAAIRSKLTKAQVEDASQLAAVTSALAGILVSEHAMSADTVHEILVGPVCAAEQTLCCELQGHMQEKLFSFNVLSVQTLAEKIRQRQECMNEAALAQSGFSPEKLKIQVG